LTKLRLLFFRLGEIDAEALELGGEIVDLLLRRRILLVRVGLALVGRIEIGRELGNLALRLLPFVLAVTTPGERKRRDECDEHNADADLQIVHR